MLLPSCPENAGRTGVFVSWKIKRRALASILGKLLDDSNFHFERMADLMEATELFSKGKGDSSTASLSNAKQTVKLRLASIKP